MGLRKLRNLKVATTKSLNLSVYKNIPHTLKEKKMLPKQPYYVKTISVIILLARHKYV